MHFGIIFIDNGKTHELFNLMKNTINDKINYKYNEIIILRNVGHSHTGYDTINYKGLYISTLKHLHCIYKLLLIYLIKVFLNNIV